MIGNNARCMKKSMKNLELQVFGWNEQNYMNKLYNTVQKTTYTTLIKLSRIVKYLENWKFEYQLLSTILVYLEKLMTWLKLLKYYEKFFQLD